MTNDESEREIPQETWMLIDELQTAVRSLTDPYDVQWPEDTVRYRKLMDEAREYLDEVEVSDDDR